MSLKKGADGAWRIAAESPTFPGPAKREPTTAEQLVAQLDEAGIKRGAVLSTAYWFGSPFMRKAEGDEYANVRAENDWVAREMARFPDRLVALCLVSTGGGLLAGTLPSRGKIAPGRDHRTTPPAR